MPSNFDRYKKDLDCLLRTGETLKLAMYMECGDEQVKKGARKALGDRTDEVLKSVPRFSDAYEPWYSERKL